MHLVIKLSKLCNLRCTYCYEYEELAKKERIPLADIEYFFKSLSEYVLLHENITPIRLIFHGGEALLLPHDYLRSVCQIRDKFLGANGIAYTTTVQSNLFKLSDKTLDLLEELNVHLGISLDVFGDQRVDIAGRVSQDKVLGNLQHLLDRKIPVGGISVLHALNVDKAVKTYQFYNQLGIDYRILPIFSHQDPPERMKHLLLSYEDTVKALQSVAKAQFHEPSNIIVSPLDDYFQAAANYLTGQQTQMYDPFEREWALIINTNGDIYPYGDSYLPVGLLGNVFREPFSEILTSEAHTNATKIRMERAETCRRCKFYRKCSQLPIMEALPSERYYNQMGVLQCTVAQPMIQFMVEEIQRSPHAQALLHFQHQEETLPQLVGV